ncbi:MAG: SusC/RagA family TonB-linked outer membrane protein [Bacteroidota bacterium]
MYCLLNRRTVILIVLLWSAGIQAQHTISGEVLDGGPSRQPLFGVSIFVAGQEEQGTSTDLEGRFSLEISDPQAILTFTYLGYATQQIQLAGRREIIVILTEDAQLLDEVVVSAIGIERSKKALGYATDEVEGDQVVSARETNLVAALSGKVAGVDVINSSGQPGASANIVIRGRTSISDSNAPLFIVDGVPIDNSYAGSNFTDQSNRAIDIDPNDIAEITVLKGAAATALYGSRAGKGAILIRTKKGQANGSTQVTFSTSLTMDVVNRLPKRQLVYAQGVAGSYVDPEAGTPSSWGPALDTLRYADDPSYTYSSIGRIVGQSSPLASNRTVEPFDNIEDFFQPGWTSNSHLSVGGGQEKANYYLSSSYLRQTGIVPNSDFTRINVKVSGEVKPTDRITVSATSSYTNSGGNRQQRGSNLSGAMLGLMRTPPSFDLTNGLEDPVNDINAWALANGEQRSYNPAYDNPYWSVNRNLVRDRVHRILGNVQASYQILPNLSLLYRIGTDTYSEERRSSWDPRSGEFGAINGLIINDSYQFTSLNSDFLLQSSNRIGERITLDVLTGHNYYQERTYNLILEGENFIIPDFYDISNTRVQFSSDFTTQERLVGAFYEVSVGIGDALYLTTAGRNDWTSTLPTGNNSFFYYSGSVGLVFSEWLPTTSALSFGKLRVSYGEVGNGAPEPYLTQTFFTGAPAVQGRTAFLQAATIGNETLVPERNQSWEAGVDLRFFQNRLQLDLSAYSNLSINQILPVPVALASGFVNLIGNAGEIENRGIEALLNATAVQGESFTWDISGNFSLNRSLVRALSDQTPIFPLPGSGLTSTRNVVIEDQPYGVIFGTAWLRDEGENVLIDENGYPLQDSLNRVVGDPNPDWLMGIRNTFSYKGVTLTCLVDIRRGGDIFNGTRGVMSNLGIHESTANREDEVVIEGVKAADGSPNDIPIQLNQDYYSRYPFAGVSEASIEDGSFVRLREVGLNWSLPKSLTERLRLQACTLGFSARNVLLFTQYSGIDPETNLSGASNSYGRDYFNSPNTKSWGLNLKAQF